MIEILTFTIALLGIVLVGLLFLRLRAANAYLRLKKYRSTEEGLADLLVYAAVVEDGVIVGKNGALMAAWLYRGADNGSVTEEDRNLLSFRLNQALSPLGSGWMIHVDALRRPAPRYPDKGANHFTDPVSRAIDEERRHLFERLGTLYEGFFVLTLTWFPPTLTQRRFVEMMFDDTQTISAQSRTRNLIDTFARECQTLESRLSSAVTLSRLGAQKIQQEDGSTLTQDDFLRWLQFCVTGLNHPVILPSNPMYLDNLMGGQELYTGVVPKIGRHFIQTVAIEGFPLESTPGMLSALAEMPLTYRWSSRFIFIDNHTAIAHLEKFRKKWKQKIRGFFDQLFNTHSGVIDQDALLMVQDAEAAMAETNSGLVAQGYYTSVLVLMDENRTTVEEAARFIAKRISTLGFAARVETVNTMEAFLGSLPGHGVENIRRPFINTLNLADLLPVSSLWTGEAIAPCPSYPAASPALMQCVTTGHSPFFLNLHVRDLGHTVMFGPTRSGKSTHLGILALQFRRYPQARVFVFDKGMSMYASCLSTGGRHFVIGGDNDRLAFAPLSLLDTRSQRSWAMEWIDSVLALNGLMTTPAQRNEIGTAIVNMHHSGARTLSEFVLTIQDEAIRDALKQYTVEGLMGHLLDAEEDGLTLADFMTFEIGQLMGMGEKYALPVLLYLFHRIEASLDGRPTLLILDEAWLMLAHPVFREKIVQWLRTLAKANCAVLMATQTISDAAKSGILDIIAESTATKIFLSNPSAKSNEETAAIYSRFGLNTRQIELIAQAVPKQDYYLVSEKGCRLYQLALGPLALAFVGATDKESIGAIEELEKNHGQGWVEEWLTTKGLMLKDKGVSV